MADNNSVSSKTVDLNKGEHDSMDSYVKEFPTLEEMEHDNVLQTSNENKSNADVDVDEKNDNDKKLDKVGKKDCHCQNLYKMIENTNRIIKQHLYSSYVYIKKEFLIYSSYLKQNMYNNYLSLKKGNYKDISFSENPFIHYSILFTSGILISYAGYKTFDFLFFSKNKIINKSKTNFNSRTNVDSKDISFSSGLENLNLSNLLSKINSITITSLQTISDETIRTVSNVYDYSTSFAKNIVSSDTVDEIKKSSNKIVDNVTGAIENSIDYVKDDLNKGEDGIINKTSTEVQNLAINTANVILDTTKVTGKLIISFGNKAFDGVNKWIDDNIGSKNK